MSGQLLGPEGRNNMLMEINAIHCILRCLNFVLRVAGKVSKTQLHALVLVPG